MATSRLSPLRVFFAGGKLRFFTPFVLFLAAANLPFWYASHAFGLLAKGVFDVEFLLLGILSLFVPRRVTALLLLAALATDLLSGISVTFLFTASETLRSVRWISQFVPRHGAGMAIFALLLLVPILLAGVAPRPDANARLRIATVLAILFVACVGFDLGTGHAPSMWHTDRQRGGLRLSRTPLRSLIVMNAQQAKTEGAARTLHFAGGTTPSASQASLLPVLSFDRTSPRPNIVLIVTESWGQPLDADLDQALVEPFNDPALRARYVVRKGAVPFHGATLDGEARELCAGVQGFSLLDASSSELAGCLPARMRRLGYRTSAFHGFTGRMYDRRTWWKTIGFEDMSFKEELEATSLPTCPGPFPGICDAALAHWIGDKLEQPSRAPGFFYWVTLNSHLPVPIPNQVEHPASCTLPATAQNPALCSWFQLIVDTQRSVAALTLRPSSRPSIFLIVGDHQPAFSTPALRDRFSGEVVPFVLLTPRDRTSPHPPLPSLAMLARHRPQPSLRRTRPPARGCSSRHRMICAITSSARLASPQDSI